jgi:hypothetical protein
MLTVISNSVDSFVETPAATHGIFIDVEAAAGAAAFNLVVRSKDKTIVGKTKTPEKAEKRFNDATGAHVPILVATADTREPLDTVAAQLLAFYSTDGAYSVRWGAMNPEAREVAAMLLPVFGWRKLNKNGWKVGSLVALSKAETESAQKSALESLRNLQKAAATLNTGAGLVGAAAMTGIDLSALQGIDPAALQSSVAAILASLGMGAPVAPTVDVPAVSPVEIVEPVAELVAVGAVEPTETTETTEPVVIEAPKNRTGRKAR